MRISGTPMYIFPTGIRIIEPLPGFSYLKTEEPATISVLRRRTTDKTLPAMFTV
jgi:hypothetical protein